MAVYIVNSGGKFQQIREDDWALIQSNPNRFRGPCDRPDVRLATTDEIVEYWASQGFSAYDGTTDAAYKLVK